jgi:uncharacterized protein
LGKIEIELFNFRFRLNIIILILIDVLLISIFPYFLSLINLPDITILPIISDTFKKSIIVFFIIAIIIAPIIETLVFQAFIIYGLQRILRKIKINGLAIPLIVSTLVFGLQHIYTLEFLIAGVFTGFILSSTFILLMKEKRNAILIIIIIHSIVNLQTFLKEFIF